MQGSAYIKELQRLILGINIGSGKISMQGFTYINELQKLTLGIGQISACQLVVARAAISSH